MSTPGAAVQPALTGQEEKAKALYDFTPTHASQMRLRKGQVVSVRSRPSEHWWAGAYCDEFGTISGLFPASYVQIIPSSSAATPVAATAPATTASTVSSAGSTAATASVVQSSTKPQLGKGPASPAIALYDFSGRSAKELTIKAQQKLWIYTEHKMVRGWAMGRDENGNEGHIPASYVKILPKPESTTNIRNAAVSPTPPHSASLEAHHKKPLPKPPAAASQPQPQAQPQPQPQPQPQQKAAVVTRPASFSSPANDTTTAAASLGHSATTSSLLSRPPGQLLPSSTPVRVQPTQPTKSETATSTQTTKPLSVSPPPGLSPSLLAPNSSSAAANTSTSTSTSTAASPTESPHKKHSKKKSGSSSSSKSGHRSRKGSSSNSSHKHRRTRRAKTYESKEHGEIDRSQAMLLVKDEQLMTLENTIQKQKKELAAMQELLKDTQKAKENAESSANMLKDATQRIIALEQALSEKEKAQSDNTTDIAHLMREKAEAEDDLSIMFKDAQEQLSLLTREAKEASWLEELVYWSHPSWDVDSDCVKAATRLCEDLIVGERFLPTRANVETLRHVKRALSSASLKFRENLDTLAYWISYVSSVLHCLQTQSHKVVPTNGCVRETGYYVLTVNQFDDEQMNQYANAFFAGASSSTSSTVDESSASATEGEEHDSDASQAPPILMSSLPFEHNMEEVLCRIVEAFLLSVTKSLEGKIHSYCAAVQADEAEEFQLKKQRTLTDTLRTALEALHHNRVFAVLREQLVSQMLYTFQALLFNAFLPSPITRQGPLCVPSLHAGLAVERLIDAVVTTVGQVSGNFDDVYVRDALSKILAAAHVMQGDSGHQETITDAVLLKHLEPSSLNLSVPAPLPPSVALLDGEDSLFAGDAPASSASGSDEAHAPDYDVDDLYPFLMPEQLEVSNLLASSELFEEMVKRRVRANSEVEWRRVDAMVLYDPIRNPLFHLAPSGIITDEQLYSCGFVDGDHHLRTFTGVSKETGEIDNGGIVATTDNAIRGEVDAGYSGTVKDAHGSLVVEIDTTGLVKGNANTTIAQLENFSFSVENLRYLAAFFLLLDGAPMLRKRAEFGPL